MKGGLVSLEGATPIGVKERRGNTNRRQADTDIWLQEEEGRRT